MTHNLVAPEPSQHLLAPLSGTPCPASCRWEQVTFSPATILWQSSVSLCQVGGKRSDDKGLFWMLHFPRNEGEK